MKKVNLKDVMFFNEITIIMSLKERHIIVKVRETADNNLVWLEIDCDDELFDTKTVNFSLEFPFFDHDGHSIYNPFMDETDRMMVHPIKYYGNSFLKGVRHQVMEAINDNLKL